MKKLTLAVLLLAGLSLSKHSIAQGGMSGEKTVEVGGAPMYPSKDIVDNAVNSKDHTTLVAAVKAAGLVDTLKGPGPFTVFAPTNKAKLTGVLTYHVVPGKMSAADLAAKVKSSNGKATLTTVQGGTLTASDAGGGKLQIVDAKGSKANVTIADVNQKNGVIHVVDTVLLPN